MNDYKRVEAIEPPVAFNPCKHHLGFLKEQIEVWRLSDWAKVDTDLLNMGNNLIDLYYGNLAVSDICHHILLFAKDNGITGAGSLRAWLHPYQYRKTKLPDRSLWVIKSGNNEEQYLHIHPAKYSPFTLRVRATTLKTVVSLRLLQDELKGTGLNLAEVNQIRTENLALSPVKMLEKGKGIARLWSVFNVPSNF